MSSSRLLPTLSIGGEPKCHLHGVTRMRAGWGELPNSVVMQGEGLDAGCVVHADLVGGVGDGENTTKHLHELFLSIPDFAVVIASLFRVNIAVHA